MASYYLPGYAAPAGVDSREKVKDYQRMLGVTADGIWGPVTQAAFEASGTSPYAAGSDAFTRYYETILGAISPPGISVRVPARAEIQRDFETMLRPGVDLAIDRRRTRGEEALAEIDADAASRGMMGSTYVTSVKEREGDDVETDIALMEAQYTGTLAERIAAALERYAALEMQAESANAQMQASARSTAAGIATQWYQNYLAKQPAAAAKSSGAKSASAGASLVSPRLTQDDYLDYVASLSADQRASLFYSTLDYWRARREELTAALGAARVELLKDSYGRTGSAGLVGAGGGTAWLKSAK